MKHFRNRYFALFAVSILGTAVALAPLGWRGIVGAFVMMTGIAAAETVQRRYQKSLLENK